MSGFRYAPIKQIHFDIDIESLNKIDDFELSKFSPELIPAPLLYKSLVKGEESKLFVRWTFRIKNTGESKYYGSYVSEQDFYIRYTTDEETFESLSSALDNSHFFSEQNLDKSLKESMSNRRFTFPPYKFQKETILHLVEQLQED